jgi:hypothetical protein
MGRNNLTAVYSPWLKRLKASSLSMDVPLKAGNRIAQMPGVLFYVDIMLDVNLLVLQNQEFDLNSCIALY